LPWAIWTNYGDGRDAISHQEQSSTSEQAAELKQNISSWKEKPVPRLLIGTFRV